MTTVLHDFVHEYDFPYHDYLLKFKPHLLDIYFNQRQNNKSVTDFRVANLEILNFINPKIDKIIETHYWVGEKLLDLGLRVYIQNNKENTSFLHAHAWNPGTLAAVFYVDPPEKGGELVFTDTTNFEFKLKPQRNKLYVFPMWLLHKPLPQEDEDYRICFNWAYGGNVRPTHKVILKPW